MADDGVIDDGSWSVVARNLPEHAGNRIHTDEGARAAGFPSALVAGVTTYAYLVHPIVERWGLEWVREGAAEVRFRAPVHADEVLSCPVEAVGPGEVVVAGAVMARDARRLVEVRAWRRAADVLATPLGDGEPLPSRRVRLDGRFGPDYAVRAGDVDDPVARAGFVHPAVWPALANEVYAAELVRGPWIHTRSLVRHHDAVPGGVEVDVAAEVVDRFQRRGERAVSVVRVTLDGRPVATVEHEAIVTVEPAAG